MANASLGIVAISMTLWAADLGAARIQQAAPATDHAMTAAAKTCEPSAQTPTDGESDLEVVVCAKPIAR